jgi:hypothetical protein
MSNSINLPKKITDTTHYKKIDDLLAAKSPKKVVKTASK